MEVFLINKMTYLKRQEIGKFWPVPRKGTKYLAVSTHNKSDSIPLVVVMRDILKLVRNKKELKKLIGEKQILVNKKEIKETNYPICLFDIISFPHSKKNFKAVLSEKKKFAFDEISEKESDIKAFKIIGKKILKGNKIQVNLSDGRNIIMKDKVNVDDSIVLNLKENKPKKIINLENGKIAYIIKGKHAGKKGEIVDIIERGGKKLVKINGINKINVWIKNIIVIEE